MYGPNVHPILDSNAEALKTLFVCRVVSQDLFLIMLILQEMFLKNFWVRTLYWILRNTPLLNQKGKETTILSFP